MANPSDLSQRVAIVTGGGRGVGRAMALGLAKAGARVVVTAAREKREIEAVAREAESALGKARVAPLVADVVRDDDCARTVDFALARFGRLDILVNNAGRGMKYVSETFMTEPTRFWETSPDAYRLVVEKSAAFPVFSDDAAQDDGIFHAQSLRLCQAKNGVVVFQKKFRSDGSLQSARPDQRRVAAFAQRQPKRVEHNRFPRARLARKHVQSPRERQHQFFDQHHIVNDEACEHEKLIPVANASIVPAALIPSLPPAHLR